MLAKGKERDKIRVGELHFLMFLTWYSFKVNFCMEVFFGEIVINSRVS